MGSAMLRAVWTAQVAGWADGAGWVVQYWAVAGLMGMRGGQYGWRGERVVLGGWCNAGHVDSTGVRDGQHGWRGGRVVLGGWCNAWGVNVGIDVRKNP